MQRLSTFNRLFVVLCILFIAFIIWKVPRESEQQDAGAATHAAYASDE